VHITQGTKLLKKSQKLFARAKKIMPGGVNSPVRSFLELGNNPVFFKQGKGPYLIDVDGNKYTDYVGSWGPLILGHCHKKVLRKVNAVLKTGMTYGAPHELEVLLAEKIISHMPSIEKIRMVNSGTEATMTAVRLARGFTNKPNIVKFIGCYHGHNDSLLVKHSATQDLNGVPSSGGVPEAIVSHTLLADFNDLASVEALFTKHPHDIAAIIVEPIAGNMGFIMPESNFLQGLRALCDKHQALLIFDEVMTGFRVALGGAQSIYNIRPDLTTLGKVIGGGMPVGAVGGKAEIMDCLAPIGTVYQAGTLSGNPLAMAAGLATIAELEKPKVYETLTKLSSDLVCGLKSAAHKHNIAFTADSCGGMFGFSFSAKPCKSYADVEKLSGKNFEVFFLKMLELGIYFAPSQFESGFVSLAHNFKIIAATVQKADQVFSAMLHLQKSSDE
jgi:glutamate-1-semialdehyde 2,1-aminomutase